MKLTKNILLLPKKNIEVKQLLKDSGRNDEEIKKTLDVTGISHLRVASPKLLTEFIFDGLELLFQSNKNFFIDIDAIIVVSQTYDQRIPSISTRIQRKFNIKPEAFCIDIMDGCSGYIKAISVAKMLEQSGYKRAFIVAGDLNSLITSRAEIGTRILFGDGLSVTIFESDSSKIDTRLLNEGDTNNIISCSSSENLMKMNGFEVFRFTRNMVPPLIHSYLNETNESLDSYDLLALHQASKLVVSTICKSLKYTNKYSEDFACGEIGNIGAGSIGAWLAGINHLESKGPLKMLAVGFGSGLSWGLASLVVDIQLNEVIYV
jgi:3-oxoacyl-[acyl-carrier-protein] synthase-3